MAAIILNWRRPEQTLACLASLARSECERVDLMVIVVDNGSADGSASLRQRYPDATVLANGRNLGFAGGNNVGIAHALGAGADYLLLLNDDAEVAPDLVRTLVAAAEDDPRIGILGPTIYYYDQPDVIWSAGGLVSPTGVPRHLHLDETDRALGGAIRDVDYVTGCAMLVRRAVVEKVGAFDPRFFAYFEETEWCARARRAGFRVVHVPAARVWHKIDPADRVFSHAYLYLMTRNRLLYLACTGAGGWRIGAACLDLLRTAASWRARPRHRAMRPYTRALIRGIWDFARGRDGAPPRWI